MLKPTRLRSAPNPTAPVRSRISLEIISGLMLPTERSDLLDGYVVVSVYGPKDKEPVKLEGKISAADTKQRPRASTFGVKAMLDGVLDSNKAAQEMDKSLVWTGK